MDKGYSISHSRQRQEKKKEVREWIEECLPCKNKRDLLWRMFFGRRATGFTREEVWAFHDFYDEYDMMVREVVWEQVDAQRWEWGGKDGGGIFDGLRVKP